MDPRNDTAGRTRRQEAVVLADSADHITRPPLGKDLDRIRSALAFVPLDDWDTCIEMAMAVKAELGDEAFPIWEEWVRQGGWFGETATWEKPSGYIEPLNGSGGAHGR
jgi:hypothetical protein